MEKIIAKYKSKEFQIFMSAIGFRIAMYIIYWGIMAMSGNYDEGITLQDYFEAWKRWDATPYLDIAIKDYNNCIENGQHLYLVFLPLYPWAIKIFQIVFRSYYAAGLAVSTFSFGIGSVYFYRMATEEFSYDVAKYAMIGLAIFPFGFFHGAIMTESLFFALLAAFMYYLRKHSWMEVTVIGVFACLTKLQGAFLCFAILVELMHSSRIFELIKSKDYKRIWKDFLLPGLRCVPMLFGVFVYLLINYLVEGNPFAFLEYQQSNWHHTLGPVWHTVKYMYEYSVGDTDISTKLVMWWPQLFLFFVVFASIIYAIIKKMRPSFITIMVVLYLVTYSSTWLISGGRYVMSILPLFIVEGQLLSKHPVLRKCVFAFSFGLMIVYMTAYYNWQQIM